MSIQIYEQKDFTGGLNLRSDQFQLADNESPEMLNVEVDPRGGVFSRGGMTRMNSVDVGGTWHPYRLYPFYGASNRLVLTNDTKVMQYSSAANTFVPIQSGGVDIVVDSDHGACFAPWGNDAYIATGTGPAATHTYRWDGTTATALPGIVLNSDWDVAGTFMRAEHLQVHANKMFASDVITQGVHHVNRIHWSKESLPDQWLKDDYFDINTGGVGISGMVVVNGALIIFKPYAIYALYGYDSTDFQLVEISTSIGCHDHNSMVQTPDGVYFYSANRGLYFFDGSNLVDIFEPMRPALDLGYINSSELDDITVSWVNGRVWLSLPYSQTGTGANVPTVNLVYDPSMRSYTMFQTADSKGVVSGIEFRDNGARQGLMIHPTVPCVLNVDQYSVAWDEINVDGSNSGFDTVYRTKWFDAGSFMQRKMFRRPDLVMRETQANQQITVDVYHDYQEADGGEARTFVFSQSPLIESLVWDEGNWAEEPVGEDPYGAFWSVDILGGAIKTIKNLGLCKSVQLRFSGEQSKAWGINSIGYKWQSRRVKG